MPRIRAWLLASVYLLAPASGTLSQETTSYGYDDLGRLISTSILGGPQNGQQNSTSFDPADNRTNYTVSNTAAAVFSISDTRIIEGGTAVVTVTRSGSSATVMTVDYATSNGTAIATSDYVAASGTLTFAVGETSKAISISTIDDSIYEGSKTFGVTLSNASSGANISVSSAVVTIDDNETDTQLSISSAAVVEGGTATLSVARAGLTGSTTTVNYASLNDTATAPSDYGAVSGTLTFLPGETVKSIPVATVDDNLYEGIEAFKVQLSGASGGAVIQNPVGMVTVGDNDSPPSFAISSASATEGSPLTMTVTKSGATALSHGVVYATANGSAVAPDDYTPVSNTLTFLPGEATKTVTVTTIDDGVYEAAETLAVQLSGATGGASISTPTGTGTINDNDQPPRLSVSNVSVTEGGYADVVVTKTGSTGSNATVTYATSDGTASTSNYGAVTGTLTFLPGETSKSVSVRTTQNVEFNAPRTFNFTISNPIGASIASPTGVVTILNDDPAPSLSALSANSLQPEGGAIRFSVVLTGSPYYATPITVNYSTSGGTATSGVDFTPVSGTLTFNPPELVKDVLVQTTQDTDVEPDETVNFNISSSNYGTIIAPQAVGTIQNDDVPPSAGPIANADNAGTWTKCDFFSVNPLTNDSDPGGHYPLRLVSVAPGTGYSVTVSGNTAYFTVGAAGNRSVFYVVANSIGQQATGTINFTVLAGKACVN